MKRFFTALVLLAAVGCSPGQLYRSEAGNYTIEFPAKPDSSAKNINTPIGRTDVQQAVVSQDGVRYEAGFADLPGDMVRRAGVKTLLQSLQQLEATEKKAKIIDVQWDEDLRGLRFIYLVEEGDSSAHYYLVRDNRMYLLSVVGPLAEVKSDRAQKFFNSFTVIQ